MQIVRRNGNDSDMIFTVRYNTGIFTREWTGERYCLINTFTS